MEAINDLKKKLKEDGIHIVDCENKNATENQIFDDLPLKGVQELIEYQILQNQDSIEDSIRAGYKMHGELPENWKEVDSVQLRKVIGTVAKKKSWFKRTDHGEFIGSVICKHLGEINDKKLGKQFQELSKWIDK